MPRARFARQRRRVGSRRPERPRGDRRRLGADRLGRGGRRDHDPRRRLRQREFKEHLRALLVRLRPSADRRPAKTPGRSPSTRSRCCSTTGPSRSPRPSYDAGIQRAAGRATIGAARHHARARAAAGGLAEQAVRPGPRRSAHRRADRRWLPLQDDQRRRRSGFSPRRTAWRPPATARSRSSWSASGSPSRRRRRARSTSTRRSSPSARRSTSTARAPGCASRRPSWRSTAARGSTTSCPSCGCRSTPPPRPSLQDGVRFKGGVGGDVLIPVNQRIPILLGSLRVEAVHLKVVLGSVDGEFAFGLEATANLTLELLSVLTLRADGLGARFTVGQVRRRLGQHRRDRQGRVVAGDPEGRRPGGQHPRPHRRRRRTDLRRDRAAPQRCVQARVRRPLRALGAGDLPAADGERACRAGSCSPRCRPRRPGRGSRARHRPAVRLEPHHRPRRVPHRHRHRRPRRGAVPRRPDRQGVPVPRRAGAAVPHQAGCLGRRHLGAVLRAQRADHVRPRRDPRLPGHLADPRVPRGPVRRRHPRPEARRADRPGGAGGVRARRRRGDLTTPAPTSSTCGSPCATRTSGRAS